MTEPGEPEAHGDLLDVGEAAEELGIGPRQVYEAIDQRDLPAKKVDGRIVIERRAIEAYRALLDRIARR
ncbi:MAG: helix-turn-helix domain-containing protein [Actinomycetota bacterium]|nr:helix-turn-helix domain-containing protein [Actinomycetota bacterium]